jgi:hypothetical protein
MTSRVRVGDELPCQVGGGSGWQRWVDAKPRQAIAQPLLGAAEALGEEHTTVVERALTPASMPHLSLDSFALMTPAEQRSIGQVAN